jgi:hypothetical protein
MRRLGTLAFLLLFSRPTLFFLVIVILLAPPSGRRSCFLLVIVVVIFIAPPSRRRLRLDAARFLLDRRFRDRDVFIRFDEIVGSGHLNDGFARGAADFLPGCRVRDFQLFFAP